MDMINTNFSNYSAWHNRSTLLARLLNEKAQGFTERENILTKEYELVLQALFTDPSDQSGWFYHLWLLDQTVTPNEILLVSSWPPHESDLVLSVDKNTAFCKPSRSTCSGYLMSTGKFPVVLYFNQTVKGVNSSSVTIDSVLLKNEDLVWKPLSLTRSQEARSWVTYLQFPDKQCCDTKIYAIEVKIDNSEDIISSSRGSQFSHPLHFRFSLSLNYNNLEIGESIDDIFDWNGGGCSGLENSDLLLFDQLKLSEDHASEFSKWQLETISDEINVFRELSEENCKFGKLTLARLLDAQDAMLSYKTPPAERSIRLKDVLELLDDLVKLDPRRDMYYEDEKSLVLMNQVTLDNKSFWSNSFSSSNHTSSNFHLCGCMQLRSLSLSRIGYVARLLWVQVLDLSHNKLRSIEGIEALQLLTCLNLRNNQICSFTALEPLKLLTYLRVLDISFNKIGAHSVDTTRYLFSSPTTQSVKVDGKFLEECRMSDIDVLSNWEAIFLFRDLHLKQLDVKNNLVAGKEFTGLLKKVLPSLTWLDDERL